MLLVKVWNYVLNYVRNLDMCGTWAKFLYPNSLEMHAYICGFFEESLSVNFALLWIYQIIRTISPAPTLFFPLKKKTAKVLLTQRWPTFIYFLYFFLHSFCKVHLVVTRVIFQNKFSVLPEKKNQCQQSRIHEQPCNNKAVCSYDGGGRIALKSPCRKIHFEELKKTLLLLWTLYLTRILKVYSSLSQLTELCKANQKLGKPLIPQRRNKD